MIIHPKKQEKKDISSSLNVMSIIDVLSLNDLYYRYSKTKTVNKYFEQQRKVYEMMKLYKETENRNLLNKIIRLCSVQTNTVILSTLRDKQIIELMIGILLDDDCFKVGNITSILCQLSKTYRNSFFATIEEIPQCFSRLIYRFDQLSIYQMFNSFYEDKDTPINSFSFIYYWICAFSQSSKFPKSITESIYGAEIWESLNSNILEVYRGRVNYTKLLNENPSSFINFFRSLSLLCKKSADIPDFKLIQDLIVSASQFLFYPFSDICTPNSSKRGTIRDDCLSTLLELYLNLPRDKYVYNNCIDLLRNHFYGSKLTINAVTYIAKNIKNPAMNSYDYDLLTISVPFRIYYINEDYLYFTNVDDLVKTRLIDEAKPNNIMMQVGFEYIKSLIQTSGSRTYQTKRNLVKSLLVLWYNSINCVLVKSDAKLVQTFLLKICILIGDDVINRTYHTLYKDIAVPFDEFTNTVIDSKEQVPKNNQKDDKSKTTPTKGTSNPSPVKNSQPEQNKDQLNLDFKKNWRSFNFELTREQTKFFDEMIEELDQLLKDSSFNFTTDFQFPSDEEEEEED